MKMRVCIDAGHGGQDSGAVFNGVMEKNINLAIALGMAHILRDEFTVIMTRSSDTYISLSRRWEMANITNVDAFVSIHCNADPDDDTEGDTIAKGAEIWVFPGSLPSQRLARCIEKYVPNFASVWRGTKESRTLAVLRNTVMAAALVEVGFVDDPVFSSKLPLAQASEAIAEGVADFLRSGKDARQPI